MRYGDRWDCSCGRSWNTSQIPPEEYWAVIRSVRRYRNVAIGVALLLIVTVLPVALVYSQRFFLLLVLLLGTWAFWVMPFLRRRFRRRLGEELPKWSLSPE